jgi:uncharacterized membrane protein
VLLGIALACVVELIPAAPDVLRTPAGLWLLFGAPIVVWRGVASRAVATSDGAWMFAVGLALLTDLLVELAVDALLPLVDVLHPLARVPLTGATAVVLIVLGVLLPDCPRPVRPVDRPVPRGLVPVGCLGALGLLLSVAGPIRLNNGLGAGVSTAALVVLAGLLVLLLVRRRQYPVGVLQLGLYLAALGLLLLTSLRGWYITGHDIQREYQVFQLSLDAGRWTPGSFPDSYNACLSITLLPATVTQLTGITGTYVFKAVLPVLFALTPVLVHRAVRNTAPQFVALLSAVYFMVFPTFFTDMPYLGRQEVAFVLLGCGLVALTDSGRPLLSRRIGFSAMLVGVVLSHYSTTYVLVAVLGLAVSTDWCWRLADHIRSRRERARGGKEREPSRREQSRRSGGAGAHRRPSPYAGGRGFITWWMVAGSAVLALVWAGPVTHTSGQLQSTLSQTVSDLLHPGTSRNASSDTSYSLFGGVSVSPAERLAQYQTDTLHRTAAQRAAKERLPLPVVDAYQPEVVPQANLPLTAVGRAIASVGVSVTETNTVIRQSTARLLQLLLLIGLVVTVRRRNAAFRPLRDQLTLSVGGIGFIALLTVLPQLSVDYGVLRAFQQGLFFFAPFIAAGTLWVLRRLRQRSARAAYVLIAALFLDLTGVVPQALGGYPAQLNLSNSGQYYDIYYTHPEELTAMAWLQQHIANAPKQTDKVPFQADRFTFDRLQTLVKDPAVDDIYPTMLSTYSYVFLGTTTVKTGESAISYQGDQVSYQYPMTLLDLQKDEIYSSDGAAVYR